LPFNNLNTHDLLRLINNVGVVADYEDIQ